MNNFDYMNGQGWQQPSAQGWAGNSYQPPFSTNIIYVTSPEEALMRTTQRNCEAVYFHQDKPIFYRVKVDMEGRKLWQAISYNSNDSDNSTPATKADLKELYNKLYELENRLQSKQSEVNNVESNG